MIVRGIEPHSPKRAGRAQRLARVWAGLLLPLTLLACGCFWGCSALREAARNHGEQGGPGTHVPRQDLAQPRTPQDALQTIARLEDARTDGGGLLQVLLKWDDPAVRARAARALGRLPREAFGRSVTEPLVGALADPAVDVRAEVAFALGLRADPAAGDALAHRFSDPSATVRARVVEAASKLEGGPLQEEVLGAATDEAVEVRIEVAVAPHRWPTEAPGARRADEVLVSLCAAPQESVEVVWRALFSLSRRRSAAGLGSFLGHLEDPDARARIFSAKGLARLAPEAGPETRERLLSSLGAALDDPDPRVATEAALGLAALADARAGRSLRGVLEHESFHVRAAVYTALASLPVSPRWRPGDAGTREPARIAATLEQGRADASPTVRAAALIAEARVRGGSIVPYLARVLEEAGPVGRAAVARAAAELPADQAVPLLARLADDSNAQVARLAIEGLGRSDTAEARARAAEFLTSPDNGLRLAAVMALRERPQASDVPLLRAAFESTSGDIGPEVRFNVLRNSGAIDTAEARSLLRAGLEDEHAYVRAVAREQLDGDTERGVREPKREPAALPPASLPPGRNPRVAVRTTKGTLVFELFPREAPVHVYSFLELARRGHYNGLDFHRVVSDFVVQGGCYRGDGNGSGTWRGRVDSLRAEIGPRKYVRGSLGMPRNEDIESGGNQLFVTHRPTPHLDGAYTILGELREGFDVLDAIEIGDRILAVQPR